MKLPRQGIAYSAALEQQRSGIIERELDRRLVDAPRDGTAYARKDGEWVAAAGGSGTIACRVEKSIQQLLYDSQNTLVSFDIVDRDDSNFWSASAPTQLTAPQNGWYALNGGYAITASNDEGNRVLRLFKNNNSGRKLIAGSSTRNPLGAATVLSASALEYFIAGEWLTMEAYRSDIAFPVYILAVPYSFLSMAKL